MYHSNRDYRQESLHHICQSESLEFSRYGSDNNKMISVDVFKIKLDTGYVS